MSASLPLLEDACTKIPHTTRKMFGGHGLFAPNGGMFAGIVTDDKIVFKLADADARAALIAAGGAPWVYHSDRGPMVMRDWILAPEAFYDEPDLMETWAARAYRLAPAKAAKRAAKKTAKKVAKKAAPKPAQKSVKKSAKKKRAPEKRKRAKKR